jgi:DNA repair/transcription protein MET18/MMS19
VLKPEILPGSNNKEVVDTTLAVVTAIVKKFDDDDVNRDIILNKIFTVIIGTLLNRDSKLYKPSMRVVLACAVASDRSCAYVLGKVLPVTLTELTGSEELSDVEKTEVLEDFRGLLSIAKDKSLLTADAYILNIQRELMKIVMASLSPELLRTTWLALVNMPTVITDENRQIVYKKLTEDLTKFTAEQVQCLLAFARVYPDEVHKLVLSSYISKSFEDHLEAKTIFKTFATLLEVPELRDHIIEVLCLNVFNNKNSKIQLVVLEVMNDILTAPKSEEIAKIFYDEWKIVIKLMDLIKNENPDEGQDVMYQASLVMNLVVRTLPNDKQLELVETYLPLMKLNESISDLYVTSGLLGFLDAAIPLEAHFDQLVHELTKLSLTTDDKTAQKLANQLLCSLFNRAPIDDKHRKILRKIFEIIKEELKKSNHKAAELLGWLSKGLLARGHPDASEILETLSELLDHPKLSKAAELAFEIISLELPQLHLPLLKHLFRQKIFVLAMKFLEHKIEKFGEHHLTAMAHVLQITPHQVLKMNIEKVGPILIKCVQSDGEHGKRVLLSLKIINHFIVEKNQYILDHLQTLVKDFLKLTQFKSTMDVRIMACKCLENLTKFPLFTLVPYKNDVLHDLTVALDDPKRLVRSAAVAARLAWYVLGENEADKK